MGDSSSNILRELVQIIQNYNKYTKAPHYCTNLLKTMASKPHKFFVRFIRTNKYTSTRLHTQHRGYLIINLPKLLVCNLSCLNYVT